MRGTPALYTYIGDDINGMEVFGLLFDSKDLLVSIINRQHYLFIGVTNHKHKSLADVSFSSIQL